jgi:HPt (histidine-containing phosphotransfer) domain-containing protein
MATDVVYINVGDALKRVMNNSKLLSNLLKKFKNNTNLSEIDAALAEGNLEKARNASHTLKGIAANLSLAELYEQIQKLESQFKDGIVDNTQLAVVNDVFTQTSAEVDKVIVQYG